MKISQPENSMGQLWRKTFPEAKQWNHRKNIGNPYLLNREKKGRHINIDAEPKYREDFEKSKRIREYWKQIRGKLVKSYSLFFRSFFHFFRLVGSERRSTIAHTIFASMLICILSTARIWCNRSWHTDIFRYKLIDINTYRCLRLSRQSEIQVRFFVDSLAKFISRQTVKRRRKYRIRVPFFFVFLSMVSKESISNEYNFIRVYIHCMTRCGSFYKRFEFHDYNFIFPVKGSKRQQKMVKLQKSDPRK